MPRAPSDNSLGAPIARLEHVGPPGSSGSTVTNTEQVDRDEHLRTLLRELVNTHPDLLFVGSDGRNDIHDIAQYPAMMVPAMQGKLLDAAMRVDERIRKVLDPFVGSGTVLVEAARRSLEFVGYDINPYAVLVAMVKAQTYDPETLAAVRLRVSKKLKRRASPAPGVSFFGLRKWFSRKSRESLEAIRMTILSEPDRSMRLLLWVVLAETVRTSSNSRTSTFKLHIRPAKERQGRRQDVIAKFEDGLKRAERLILSELARPRAAASSEPTLQMVQVKDVTKLGSVEAAGRCDILISSPPYGDNATTVPYGQFSYLPLCWMNLKDIAEDCPTVALRNTHALDSASLGGSRRFDAKVELRLRELSPAYAGFLDELPDDTPRDRKTRVTAFVSDLESAVRPILGQLKPSALMFWTVGNRRVANRLVPLDRIVRELFEAAGCVHVVDVKRRIPSKRMAVKNSVSETMRGEVVVVLRAPTVVIE